MSKEYIASVLKRLRENTKFTADEVGAMVGKSGKTVNAWENGRGQPDAEMLIKLCGIYKVNNILAEFDDSNTIKQKNSISTEESKVLSQYRALDYFGKKAVDELLATEYDRCTTPDYDEQPMIQIKHSNYKVSAGTGFDLSEGDDWRDMIDVPDTPEARKADYALTIQGNSMEPVFRNDDVILVKQQDAVDLGQIGIFVLNGAGYIKKNGGDRLISLNDEYDDILIDEYDNCHCVGRVIGRAW